MTHRPIRVGSRPSHIATTVVGLVALTATTAASLASLAACAGSQGAAPSGKIVVVASTNVWASVASAVGGAAVSVTALLSDPNADPHGYEAKPADAAVFADANLVLSNGGGYDDYFTPLVDASGTKATRVVAFDLAQPGRGVDNSLAAPADAANDTNEHVWYDLDTVRKVADKVADNLTAIAPDKAAAFRANAATFDRGLQDIAAKAAQIGQRKPGTKVLSTEPVAAYLLHTAGITDVTPAEYSKAVEEESDPPAEAVAVTTAMVSDREVAAVVDNSQTETAVTRRLKEAAGAAGVPVVGVTETLPPGVTGYLDWMTKQVDALAKAVG
ncbi:metal ABC transporter solute-binding protein, Zn/Mn family [Actinokineospora inagensis]|uniref:metal ABC transporter solute-binding protein, Zn/Mn family n=1 Tax=Actinokineospora inagensis TaxID=103730 RepID=UPI00068809E3|nr:zinc ABC transporter substrate-binding protein [Actinokineospora inagensis]